MSTKNDKPVAVVTAAAQRLGRAIALAFARAGYDLVVHYRASRTLAEETAELATACGARVVVLGANLAMRATAEQFVANCLSAFPRVNVLVANAGAFERTPVNEFSEDACQRMLADNLFATLWVARAFGVEMRASGGGSIVALADVAALRPWRGYLAYNIAKAGVVAVVRTLAKELAPEVRVNAIAPGPVLFPPDFDRQARQREVERTLLKREGLPDHVADAALFLCRNDYVTGVVLPVDGGRLLAGDDGY